jgi:hypothetical protein
MATDIDLEARERERLLPFAQELFATVRQADPEATYSLVPGPDAGIWLLNVFVRSPLHEDLDLHAAVTERAVDFQVHNGISLAVIPHQRTDVVAA